LRRAELLDFIRSVYETASVLYGLGVGALFRALQTWMLMAVAQERRSAASATFYNMIDSGLWGGTILFGLLAEKTGFGVLYGYSAAVMAVFLLLYGVSVIRGKTSHRALAQAGYKGGRI